MEYLGILGFMLFGYLLPEFILLLGNTTHTIPVNINAISAISAGLISTAFLIN